MCEWRVWKTLFLQHGESERAHPDTPPLIHLTSPTTSFLTPSRSIYCSFRSAIFPKSFSIVDAVSFLASLVHRPACLLFSLDRAMRSAVQRKKLTSSVGQHRGGGDFPRGEGGHRPPPNRGGRGGSRPAHGYRENASATSAESTAALPSKAGAALRK